MAKKSKSGFKTVKTKFRGNFEVPIGWDLSKLGDECKFEYGKALIEENRNNRGFFVYGSGGRIGKNSKFFTKGPGIIVARKGSLGNVFYEKQNFWPIDTVFYISKKETNHHLQFIFYILVYLKLENYKIVTAHPGISRDEVYTIFVKIPSFDEQKKIANILSNIDDVIDKYNSIIEITKKLQTSMMQQLFTKGIRHKKFKKSPIGEIPIEWSVKKLKKVTEKIERGKFSHRPRNDPKFYDGKYPFIQTGDVESSNGRITTFSQTLNELGLSVSKLFPKNTIVITIAANIGSTAITTFPVCFPDSLIGISAKNINLIFLLTIQ